MKNFFCLLTVLLFTTSNAFPDTIVLEKGNAIDGEIIQTNEAGFLLLTDYGTYRFSKNSIRKITASPATIPQPDTMDQGKRYLDFKHTVSLLSRQPWASGLNQIPATVIDKGILQNVPYLSFRCDTNYEVNVYGDLNDPAGIEIGVYHELLDSNGAKSNCLAFISSLLIDPADKGVLQSLDVSKDIKSREGLTFEITPPTADDAYMGWWVSIYSEEKLKLAKATSEELANISVARESAASSETGDAWSADDLKSARALPETITFSDSNGDIISNAVVVRVVDKAYVIWRKGASGGRVKLSTLSQSVRDRFGYDQNVATAVYDTDEHKAKAEKQIIVVPPSPRRTAVDTELGYLPPVIPTGPQYVPASGGRVYVRGYYRKDGTYVRPHTRRR